MGVTVPAEMFACLDEKGENYLVQIELPGVENKDIALTMHEDLVSVRVIVDLTMLRLLATCTFQ